LYGKSAAYYDAIYSWKNYKKESDLLQRFIRHYKKSPGKRLLDVACGTGNHISYLKRRFDVEGLDADPSMLRQAKRKHPEIRFYKRDMCTFQLGWKYDVVTCLFSAIGHVKTVSRLRQAIRQMAKHLEPGGLMILEPWFTPKQWTVGRLDAVFVKRTDLKLARISISKRNARLSFNDEHFLIGTPQGVKHFVKRLDMGLFTNNQYRDAIKSEGLIVRYDRKGLMGRGLYFGLKPMY
jgi:ubiquinone/menaquinone biosynthesis C-methylase UbiE